MPDIEAIGAVEAAVADIVSILRGTRAAAAATDLSDRLRILICMFIDMELADPEDERLEAIDIGLLDVVLICMLDIVLEAGGIVGCIGSCGSLATAEVMPSPGPASKTLAGKHCTRPRPLASRLSTHCGKAPVVKYSL